MSIVTMPTSLRAAEFSFDQLRFDTMERSDSTGAEAARLLAPPRWMASMQSVSHMALIDAGVWRAWLRKGRGPVNVYAIFDPVRQQPEGTLRGSPRLLSVTAAGSTTMTLVGGYALTAIPGTLKQGDLLQVSTGVGTSQLVEVVEDATSTGTGLTTAWTDGLGNPSTWSGGAVWFDGGNVNVTFEPPLRYAFSNGTAVTWDRPLAYYRRQGTSASRYTGYRQEGGFAADFVETFQA